MKELKPVYTVMCRYKAYSAVNNDPEPKHDLLFIYPTFDTAQACVDTLYKWKFTPKEILKECVKARGTDDNEAMLFLANQLIKDALILDIDEDLIAEEIATILLFECSNYDLDFYVRKMAHCLK